MFEDYNGNQCDSCNAYKTQIEYLKSEVSRWQNEYAMAIDDVLTTVESYNKLESQVSQLWDESEKLKNTVMVYQALKDIESSQVIILEKENERLKEALRKCNPFTAFEHDSMHPTLCYSCGINVFHSSTHKNCEYIKLCGEGGE